MRAKWKWVRLCLNNFFPPVCCNYSKYAVITLTEFFSRARLLIEFCDVLIGYTDSLSYIDPFYGCNGTNIFFRSVIDLLESWRLGSSYGYECIQLTSVCWVLAFLCKFPKTRNLLILLILYKGALFCSEFGKYFQIFTIIFSIFRSTDSVRSRRQVHLLCLWRSNLRHNVHW